MSKQTDPPSISLDTPSLHVASVFMGMPVGGAEDLAIAFADTLPNPEIQTHFVCLRELGILGKEIKNAQKHPIEQIRVAPGKRFSPVGLFRLIRWLRKHKIDIVHSHTYHAHAYAIRAARWLGIPSILHHHKTADDLKKMKPRRRRGLGKLLHKSSAILTLSKQSALDLQTAYKLPDKKFHTIENPVNRKAFAPLSPEKITQQRSKLGLAKDRFLIGTVASLNAVKNHTATLQAATNLETNCDLIILGEGKERSHLEKLASSPEIHTPIFLMGNQRPIAPWMQCFDLFVLPSLWEGQSLALLQAISTEIPILASCIEGNTTLLGHDHPGLFDPNNIPAYAQLLKRATEETTFRNQLLAHQKKLTLPTLEDATQNLLQIYKKLSMEKAT
ncbi:MAG: glycosyltransferase [Chthoniobacterales bacterium]